MKVYVIILLVLTPSLAISQIQVDWSVIYHPLGNSINGAYVVNNLLNLDSQGNIVCGWQNDINQFPQYSSLGVTSFDLNGNLNWEHEYFGSFGGNNYLHSCIIDINDNVYIMGQVNANTFASDDVNINYDIVGNQVWKTGDDSSGGAAVDTKIIDNSYFNLSRGKFIYKYESTTGILIDSITVDTIVINGGSVNEFMLSEKGNLFGFGYTGYFSGSNTELYVCKTDTSGNIFWKKILDPTLVEDIPFKADIEKSGTLFLLARTNYISSTTPESAYTCAIDSMGDTLWTRFYNPTPTTQHCYASDIITDNNGHVYISANAMDISTSRWNAVVIQYDAITGNKNWEVWLDSSLVYNLGGIKLALDSSGFLYVGYNRLSPGYLNLDIVKLDSSGNTLWHSTFDTIGNNHAFIYDGQGSFYCGGSKLSKFSLVSDIDESYEINEPLSIYPNPVIDKIHFKSFINGINYIYTVYDISGRKLKNGFIYSNQGIEVKGIQSGIYIITLQSKNKIYTGKFLKK